MNSDIRNFLKKNEEVQSGRPEPSDPFDDDLLDDVYVIEGEDGVYQVGVKAEVVTQSLEPTILSLELPSSDSGGNYTSSDEPPSSELGALSVSSEKSGDEVILSKREQLRNRCQSSNVLSKTKGKHTVGKDHEDGRALSQHILDRIKKVEVDWCILARLTPTKTGGYAQVSHGGVNNFAVLQELVLWSKGVQKPPGISYVDGEFDASKEYDVSHLCHSPRCTVASHITVESKLANNARKGCEGWVRCSDSCNKCHGRKVISICRHTPMCIVYHDQYASFDEFLSDGICSDRSSELIVRNEKKRTSSSIGLKSKSAKQIKHNVT